MRLPVAWPPAGRYILAISGGADSMVLLDLFAVAAETRGYDLVVAHFDHGTRADSFADAAHVEAAGRRYNLKYVSLSAGLGPVSEATARAARHAWLEHLRLEHEALAVVTAHHRDDIIETSLLNLARGSGRRGLAPMQAGAILRPLSRLTRLQLREYARAHQVIWREDPTNLDLSNPRNFLRHRLLPLAPREWEQRYLDLLDRLSRINNEIDEKIERWLGQYRIGREEFSFAKPLIRDLSMAELEELLVAGALSLDPFVELDRRLVAELALFAKTASPHRRRPVRGALAIVTEPQAIRLVMLGEPTNAST